MTKRDALSVSLKILGLVALYRAVLTVIVMWIGILLRPEMSNSTAFRAQVVWLIAVPALLFVAGCILLRWGDTIAAKLVRQDAELPAIAATGWQKPVFVVALKVVGVVFLVNGVAGLVRVAAQVGSGLRLFTGYAGTQTYHSIVLVALAVYLLTGAKHLVAFAFRERKS